MIFKSKTKAYFALICILLLSVYSLKNIQLTRSAPSEYEKFTVEFEYFGMDAEKIEKIVAIPFEEKAAKLEGLISIRSVSEYSKCAASLTFEKNKVSSYAKVSDIVDELKKSLPKDAQTPKIYALDQDSKHVFCAAFDKKAFRLEDLQGTVLKALQGIPGVSQATIVGGERMEVHIAFDDKLMARYGALPWDLASNVQKSQAQVLFGDSGSYKAKIATVEDIKKIPKMDAICKAMDSFQKRESAARLNGKECLLLTLKSSEENQNIGVCKKARKTLNAAFKDKKNWTIVYDNGQEQEKSIKKILAAFFETLAALTIAVWFIFRSAKKTIIALAFTASDVLTTFGLLCALRIPLDSPTICGITISLGLLCDAALYILDDSKAPKSSIIICALTTIAAIVPLFKLDAIVPGVKALARACAISTGLSSLLALLFLPAFIQEEESNKKNKRVLNLYKILYNKSKISLNLYCFLYIIPLVLFICLPKNLKQIDSDSVIYAQVEYNPEKRFELVDEDLLPFLEKARALKGVKFIQSEAKRGRAELQIVLKKAKDKDKISKSLLEYGKSLKGSLYIPLAPPKRKLTQKMQIAVLGDDASKCRQIAKDAAPILLAEKFLMRSKAQLTLNFKEDETFYVARPNKDFLNANGLSVQDFAQFLRWNLFGPVATKIMADGRQKDARLGNIKLAFSDSPKLEGVKNLSLKSIPVSALCSLKKEARASKVFRKDFRRAAYFTIEIEGKNSGKFFKTVKKALKAMQLPDGYYFSWPKEYECMPEDYAQILLAFFIAAATIFFLVAAQSEDLRTALLVLGTIPVSLSLPIALRALSFTPLTLGDAVGMVFISGICVNNALYILGERMANKKNGSFAAAKKVLKSVLSSSITTLVAALPVMLSGAGAFASDLAFFMFFGSLASVFAGLIYFPAALEVHSARKTKKGPAKRQGAFIKIE